MECMDKDKESGFIEDDLSYRHRCENHKPKRKCLKCTHYDAPYCESVYWPCPLVDPGEPEQE